jgi:hypothetical protein
MSLTMRVSFSSAATFSSDALRCCRMRCACSGSLQKSGCEVLASRLRISSRWRGTSKIAPHELDALVEFLKTMFEIFDNHGVNPFFAKRICATLPGAI